MRVMLCVSFAGQLEQHDCPAANSVINVSPALAEALCADGRAVRVGGACAAVAETPEVAMRPSAKGRRR